jgi:hypothetical protein
VAVVTWAAGRALAIAAQSSHVDLPAQLFESVRRGGGGGLRPGATLKPIAQNLHRKPLAQHRLREVFRRGGDAVLSLSRLTQLRPLGRPAELGHDLAQRSQQAQLTRFARSARFSCADPFEFEGFAVSGASADGADADRGATAQAQGVRGTG